jgi:cobalamin biosynthesis protein CobD/CbiB
MQQGAGRQNGESNMVLEDGAAGQTSYWHPVMIMLHVMAWIARLGDRKFSGLFGPYAIYIIALMLFNL